MKTLLAGLVGTMLISTSFDASAQSTEYQLGQIVTKRKLLMHDLQTNYWTLLAVKNGDSSDYQGAAEAASQMSATLNEFLALMEPGTALGEVPGSRAKPEVWTEAGKFAAVAEAFQNKAVQLANVAEGEDPVAFVTAFNDFAAACTGCHDLRPSSGGQFRFAKDE